MPGFAMIRNLAAYLSITGSVYQSILLEKSMSVKLVKMGTAGEKATAMQFAADRDASLSLSEEEKAALDEAEGTALQEEAMAMQLKGEEDAASAAEEEVNAEDLAAQSALEESEAEALFAQATADEAMGREEMAESTALAAEGEADAALAAEEELAADELTAQAAEEEGQATLHFGEAAAEELLYEEEVAEASAEAALASTTAMEATGGEVGTAMCNFIPLLDILCDVVGGTAAVGLEATAASEAAEAAAEFAAAAAVKAEEDAELAMAVEFQAKAAEDAEAALGLQAEAAELETESEEMLARASAEEAEAQTLLEKAATEEETAEEEQALAAKDAAAAAELQSQAASLELEAEQELAQSETSEAASKEKMEQATLEEEASAEETAQAAEEQSQSVRLLEESMMYGLGAFWDLIMAGAIALFASTFFAIRVITAGVVHVSTLTFPAIAYSQETTSSIHNLIPIKSLSYTILHTGIFAVTAGLYTNGLCTIDHIHLRAQGGLILLFALSAAACQGLCLHAVPHGFHNRRLLPAVWTFVCSTTWLTVFFTLEVLILWVNFGHVMFVRDTLTRFHVWYLWVLLMVGLVAHFLSFELGLLCCSSNSSGAVESVEESMVEMGKSEKKTLISETAVPSYHGIDTTAYNDIESVALKVNASKDRSNTKFWSTGWEKLLLPFEILMLSCMFQLLRHCFPNIQKLWPIFHVKILSKHPDWFINAIGPCISLFFGMVLCLFLYCTSREVKV